MAQQDDALIRGAEMLFAAVVDITLAFLGDPVLIVRCDAPPAVLDTRINSGFVVFETDGFKNERFAAIGFIVRREAQPKGRRFGIVGRHAETNRMVGDASFARGGVTRM